MIYTNPYPNATSDAKDEQMHLWLDGMVGEEEKVQLYDEDGNEEGVQVVPSLAALCGLSIDELAFPGSVEPHVKPASETWADGLIDLLGDNRLCEECRTRAAVYFDRQDEVTLKATNHEVPVCPECDEDGRDAFKRKAHLANIVSKKEGTVVERALECNECGHEWEDEIGMEALE